MQSLQAGKEISKNDQPFWSSSVRNFSLEPRNLRTGFEPFQESFTNMSDLSGTFLIDRSDFRLQHGFNGIVFPDFHSGGVKENGQQGFVENVQPSFTDEPRCMLTGLAYQAMPQTTADANRAAPAKDHNHFIPGLNPDPISSGTLEAIAETVDQAHTEITSLTLEKKRENRPPTGHPEWAIQDQVQGIDVKSELLSAPDYVAAYLSRNSFNEGPIGAGHYLLASFSTGIGYTKTMKHIPPLPIENREAGLLPEPMQVAGKNTSLYGIEQIQEYNQNAVGVLASLPNKDIAPQLEMPNLNREYDIFIAGVGKNKQTEANSVGQLFPDFHDDHKEPLNWLVFPDAHRDESGSQGRRSSINSTASDTPKSSGAQDDLPRQITINGPLIGVFSVATSEASEAVDSLREKVEQVLLDILYSANAIS